MKSKSNILIKKKLNSKNKPYIIAEIGSNFNQSLSKAKKLISKAKECGADAVKFQLFKANVLYPNDIKMNKLFKSIELNTNWVKILKKYSDKNNIDFLCSSFDMESAKLLEANKVIAHKIASSEIVNLDLVNFLIKTKKYIFASFGMSDIIDVKKIIQLAKKNNNKKIILMQCVAMYPLKDNFVNLNVIKTLSKFGYPTGFSDHTPDGVASIAAVALGAQYFEKHFTLNKTDKGPDHIFAMEPKEFKLYVQNIHRAHLQLGSNKKEMVDYEKKFCRRDGLYFSSNFKKGHIINKNSLYSKRPALGIRTRDMKNILGKKLKRKVYKNNPIFNDHI